jgi:hypothetical protein
MFVNAKTYNVKCTPTSFTPGGALTFAEMVASATRLLVLLAFTFTQSTSTTSTVGGVQAVLKSGAATGGAAFTPVPTQVGQGASSFTAKVGSTAFSAEGTVSATLLEIYQNYLQGFNWQPQPDQMFWAAPSGIMALRFPAAQGVASWALDSYFGEIG